MFAASTGGTSVMSEIEPVDQAYIHWFEHVNAARRLHPRAAFTSGWYGALDRLYAEATGLGARAEVLSPLDQLWRSP
jgi:hypothetical protein